MIDQRIVCTYLYLITRYGYPPPAKDTIAHLGEMKRLGFRSVELEGIREEHLLEMHDLRHQIAAELQRLSLEVPYFCAVLPGLTSREKSERKRQLKLFEKGCEVARAVNARGILDNAPLPPYVFPEDIPVVRHYSEDVLISASFPGDLTWKQFWDYLVETLREACDIAGSFDLTYQLHPSIGVLSANADGFLYLNDAVGRENLRFNLDTANQFVMKENLPISIRRLAGYIDYIHVSDARGHKVEHLEPGHGSIRWSAVFDALKETDFNGLMGLDVGGDESLIADLDEAYLSSARWLTENWAFPEGAADPQGKLEWS